MFKQLLATCIITNVLSPVWRISVSILGLKGLNVAPRVFVHLWEDQLSSRDTTKPLKAVPFSIFRRGDDMGQQF